MDANAWGDPNYYALLDYAIIETHLFEGLITASIDRVYLVKFQAWGVDDPGVEPFGVYHYAGIRRFIWKEQFFSEMDLPYRPVMEKVARLLMDTRDKDQALNYRKLLDFLKYYGQAPAPNFDSTFDNILADPELRTQKFVRAIYRIV